MMRYAVWADNEAPFKPLPAMLKPPAPVKAPEPEGYGLNEMLRGVSKPSTWTDVTQKHSRLMEDLRNFAALPMQPPDTFFPNRDGYMVSTGVEGNCVDLVAIPARSEYGGDKWGQYLADQNPGHRIPHMDGKVYMAKPNLSYTDPRALYGSPPSPKVMEAIHMEGARIQKQDKQRAAFDARQAVGAFNVVKDDWKDSYSAAYAAEKFNVQHSKLEEFRWNNPDYTKSIGALGVFTPHRPHPVKQGDQVVFSSEDQLPKITTVSGPYTPSDYRGFGGGMAASVVPADYAVPVSDQSMSVSQSTHNQMVRAIVDRASIGTTMRYTSDLEWKAIYGSSGQ